MRAQILLATLLTLSLAPFVSADHGGFTTSGSFLVGSPYAYFFRDACFEPLQEGIDSNCVTMDDYYDSHPYTLTAVEPSGTMQDAYACFFSGSSFISCPDDGLVPDGADTFSVSALGGVAIEWTLTITG